MVEDTLVIGTLFAVAAGMVYVHVGTRVRARTVAQPARLAAQMFAVWWFALGGTTLLSAAASLAAGLDLASVRMFTALQLVNVALICVGLLGLLYYLVYLFTGRRGAIVPLTAFYALYFALLVWYIVASGPSAIEMRSWSARLHYDHPVEGIVFQVIVGLLVLPQIVGALAYFALFFKVKDRARRYRIALVSWSIVVWFASALMGAASGLSDHDWWQLTSRAIGLAAALTILAAYRPPVWVQRRFRVQPLPT